MGAFKCKNDDNYCFYDWMYAAYWFSNDSVENKCSNLITTWCAANKVYGDLNDDNVTKMVKHFWGVWTKVSCHLG